MISLNLKEANHNKKKVTKVAEEWPLLCKELRPLWTPKDSLKQWTKQNHQKKVPPRKLHLHDYPYCHNHPRCPTDSTKPGTALVQAKEQSEWASILVAQWWCRGRDLHAHGQCPTSQPWCQRMAPATFDGIETALGRNYPSKFVKRELQQVLQRWTRKQHDAWLVECPLHLLTLVTSVFRYSKAQCTISHSSI